MNFDISASAQNLLNNIVAWAPKLVAGLLILIIGFWIIGWIMKLIDRSFNRSDVDEDLRPFLHSVISVLLKVMLIITVAGIVGIEITAIAALIAGAGLAIGMALQGTLGHFASGVMILLFKPYRSGDLVSLQDQLGHVDEIQIFNTIITTLDNKKVIIPNGLATSGIITNLSAKGKLRVDLNVAMPYEENFDKVQAIISKALNKVTSKLDDEPTIEIEKFDANNVLLAVRPYATPEKYWDVYFQSYQEIKRAFAEAGIEVAYPTRRISQIQ